MRAANASMPRREMGASAKAAHGLSGEMGGKLRERECVDALATGGKSVNRKFRGGGSCGCDEENFAVRGLSV